MIIRQISKNHKKKHGTGIIKDGMEKGLEKLDKKLDVFTDGEEYVKSKDSTNEEKKPTEKLGEEKPKHDIDSLLDDLKRDAGKTKIDDN